MTRKQGKTRVTRGMQSNYDGSTHRRHKTTNDSSSSDLPNPEHEAIGRLPWVNLTIRVNIFIFFHSGAQTLESYEIKNKRLLLRSMVIIFDILQGCSQPNIR
jgi:hypothetical protein